MKLAVPSLIASVLAGAQIPLGLHPEQTSSVTDQPLVRINGNQVIKGSYLNNAEVEAFRGIPYAEPPVDNLKFRHPKPYKGSYKDLDATDFGDMCHALASNLSALMSSNGVLGPVPSEFLSAVRGLATPHTQSEDCLFLNVFRPKNAPRHKKLPVMVWIHGGAFVGGSSSSYKGENIVSESERLGQPVIYVSMNYRLGPWGWLNGKEAVEQKATNLGFLDQRLAIQWVADHIASFGGDPDNVTIFGESAGAMSTTLHLTYNDGDHTYKGKPLFHRAIMQSGALLPTTSSTADTPQKSFDELVEKSGCENSDDKIECLRHVDPQIFKDYLTSLGADLVMFSFGPHADGHVLPDPYEAWAKGKVAKVPYISGNQEDEGTIFALVGRSSFGDTITKDGEDAFVEVLQTMFPKIDPGITKALALAYPNDPSVGSPYHTGQLNRLTPQYKRFASIFGDILFESGRRYIIKHTSNDIPVYTYVGTHGLGTPYIGTLHAADIFWQYELDHLNFGPSKAYNGYFISFANTGDPNRVGGGPNANSLKGIDGLPYWPPHSPNHRVSLQIAIDSFGYIEDNYREAGITLLSDPSARN